MNLLKRLKCTQTIDHRFPTAAATFAVTSLMAASLLSGCGSGVGDNPAANLRLPPVGVPDAQGIVVKSRAVTEINTGAPHALMRLINGFMLSAFAAQEVISVTNGTDTAMTMDSSQWSVPSQISSQMLNFGILAVSDLRDNNTRVCGADGKTKCTKAIIRAYTTGKPGGGLWNTADGYGSPVLMALAGEAATATVGLESAGAITLQSISIANNKNVIRETDFTPTPAYGVNADFTNAGVGTFSGTLVIEYALSL